MSIVLVWVLVTIPTNGVVTYSPPLVDIQDCQALRKQVSPLSQCIQIRMVK
jgi:hypothetical protein